MNAQQLADALRETRGFAHKRDISGMLATLDSSMTQSRTAHGFGTPPSAPQQNKPGNPGDLGDDCAVLPDPAGDGHLLFAIEGLVDDFVRAMPWFAGYCSVMVNVSDIYAMGGRPLAVVDALWSAGADAAQPLLQGMAEASAKYGVPIVGGHTNNRSPTGQLAVAILGRAQRLLSSFAARPGDDLLMAIDLRGAYEEPYAYWNASTAAPAARLRGDLEILPTLAEDGLCDAAKDISMAGAVGTALMLLESSGCGASINADAIPAPANVALLRWLTSFPSYGFVLSVRPAVTQATLARFAARGIAGAVVGRVDASRQVTLQTGGASAPLWNFETDRFISAAPSHAGPSHV